MNKDWQQLDKDLIWHPYTPLLSENLVVESAKGAYIKTLDGRNILDAVSSWWVNIHGHSHPDIAEAIYKQALELEHVIFASFTHKPAIELAEGLLSILPSNQSRIFFSDNGSTAVEAALKMALQYWNHQNINKTKIVALEGAYHGDTFGAMSIGAKSLFTAPFENLLFETEFIPFPEEDNCIEVFEQIAQKGDVAAFIYEPLIQGTAGMRIYGHEKLNTLLQIAKDNNIICIADEVMTGFGRTGKLFASDYLENKPDLICLSKGITGGSMPLGVTSCSGAIADSFKNNDRTKMFFHGHSYTGNPLACAASLASLKLLLRKETSEAIEMISKCHSEFVTKNNQHPQIISIDSLGTILSIEINTGHNTSYFNNLREYLYNFFIERNILIRPLGNIIYLIPPYIVTKKELGYIYAAIEELLADIK